MKVSILRISTLVLVSFLFSQAQAQQERPKKEDVFAQLDTNIDGYLDKVEFLARAENKKEKRKEKFDTKKSFDRMDQNKNGSIEFEEYEKMVEKREQKAQKSQDEVFGNMDTNSDELISAEEFMAHNGSGPRKK